MSRLVILSLWCGDTVCMERANKLLSHSSVVLACVDKLLV